MRTRKGREPSPVIARRLAEFRQAMKQRHISRYLVSKRWDLYYLLGFSGEDSAAIITPQSVHLLTDGRFQDNARTECPWAKAWIRRGMLNAEIAKGCRSLRIKRLAVQADFVTLADRKDLMKQCRTCRFSPGPPILAEMRRIKDPDDLAAMRRAIRVAEEAFEALRRVLRPGLSELEVAAKLEYEMRVRGADSPAFPTICAEGSNAALPHARAGRRRIKRGSALLIDWGARVGNYCSDLTRVVFIGSIRPAMEKAYLAALRAQALAIDAIKPGARMCDVDAVARNCIAEAGFKGKFTHGLGHGLGLDVHEPPSLSWRSDEPMKAGMVVTVEPGIYLRGVGGVRIEDDVLVTETGCRVLTRLAKSLDATVIR
jgi:Xaa-Pro aminopeptidase